MKTQMYTAPSLDFNFSCNLYLYHQGSLYTLLWNPTCNNEENDFSCQISGNEKSRSCELQHDCVEICWIWGGEKNIEAVHHVTSFERYWQHWSTEMYRHMTWRALYLLGEPELRAFFMSLEKKKMSEKNVRQPYNTANCGSCVITFFHSQNYFPLAAGHLWKCQIFQIL